LTDSVRWSITEVTLTVSVARTESLSDKGRYGTVPAYNVEYTLGTETGFNDNVFLVTVRT